MISRTAHTLRNLFTGHEAGHFSLPDEVLVAHRAVGHLAAADLPDPGPSPLQELIDATLAAAQKGDPLPDAAPLVEHERAQALADHQQRIVRHAKETASDRLFSIVAGHVEAIVVDHLRPALAEAYEQARAAAKKLAGRPLPDDRSLLLASNAERKAWTGLDAIIARIQAVRTARSALALHHGYKAEYDPDGRFALYRHPERAGLVGLESQVKARLAAIGDDPRQRLLWEVTSGVEPWLPTPDEQDRAFATHVIAEGNAKGPYLVELYRVLGETPPEWKHRKRSAVML